MRKKIRLEERILQQWKKWRNLIRMFCVSAIFREKRKFLLSARVLNFEKILTFFTPSKRYHISSRSTSQRLPVHNICSSGIHGTLFFFASMHCEWRSDNTLKKVTRVFWSPQSTRFREEHEGPNVLLCWVTRLLNWSWWGSTFARSCEFSSLWCCSCWRNHVVKQEGP